MNPREPSMLTLGLKLALIAGAAAVILALADTLTLPARETAKARNAENAMRTVMPPYDRQGQALCVVKNAGVERVIYANSVTNPIVLAKFTPVYLQNKLTGYAAQGESLKGYGGKIAVIFGISPEGTVGIVSVTESNETPGLGTAETERKRQKTLLTLFESDSGLAPNPYLDQFSGKTAGSEAAQWTVGEGVRYKTGATVTMRAVADAVSQAAAAFARHRETLNSKAQK